MSRVISVALASQAAGAWIVRILGAICVIGTLLPLLPTGFWFIRGWDFPRFQLASSLLLSILLAVVCRSGFKTTHESAAWLAILSAAFIWQASHVLPLTRLWTKEVEHVTDETPFRLVVANLNYMNEAHAAVSEELRRINADILILIEPNEKWSAALAELRQQFSFHHEEVRADGLGLLLWSKLPIKSAETRFLVEERRPSIWASIALGAGETNLVAVHPTPPGLQDSTGDERRDSRVRDAELILIAEEIKRRKDEAWIVAGDFNDVAWSHTTRLFKRLGGLKDPRVGRSFMGTYHSRYPLVRFPIDHVFLSDGFSLGELRRHRITGSDHFAVSASIALTNPREGVTPEPEGNDRSEAQEIIKEGKEDAKQRDILSDET